MRAGTRRRFELAVAATLVAIVGCATTPTPTPQVSEGPDPSATPTASEASPSSGTGEIGTEPIGGWENQPAAASNEPTAIDLVNAAVEAGRIDADTGLMYRIFASFGDERLPTEYAADAFELDHGSVAAASYRLDQGLLPPAIAEAVRPYLLRPTDPDSAFNDASAGSARLATTRSAPVLAAANEPVCDETGWASLKSATEPVKVWVRCSDPRMAGLLSDAIAAAETLYAELADSEMMGPAIPDQGAPDTAAGKRAGGDSSIDIYFTSRLVCVDRQGSDCKTLASRGGAGMAVADAPWGARPAYTASGYLVIDRQEGDSKPVLWSTIAHELFHVLQNAHNLGGMLEGETYHWFEEASATWAEESFVPDARETEVYPHFDRFQKALVGLTSVDGLNEYDSFVWPYFMEQKAGYRKIGDAWRALRGKVGFEAANAALASVFSFETNYKDFAVQALNARLQPGNPTAPNMQKPDANFPVTGPAATNSVLEEEKQSLLGRLEVPLTQSVKVPPLAMRYYVFGVGGAAKKLVIDMAGVQPSHALDAEALLFIHDKGWERRSLSDGKTTFCKDRPEDDVDGAILVIANHSWVPAEALTGSYTIDPSAEPCSDERDLHLGGRITWNAASPGRFGYAETVSGMADVVIHVVTNSLLVAERDDHSTYNYEYTSGDDRCPVSVESGTLESGGGVGGGQPSDYSIGTLNVGGGRLGQDLSLYINMPDYCGPSMGGSVGNSLSLQGFPSCASNSQIVARFDGVDSYVIDCDVTVWGNVSASGHISGVLRILDGPHPTPPY